MKAKLSMGSRAGVTLIELLVVVLIVVILAVAMLPILEPFITRAKYAADAIPALGNLRTQIALYKSEKECLPGIQRNSNRLILNAVGDTTGQQKYGNSNLAGTDVDTFETTMARYGQTFGTGSTYFVQSSLAASTMADATPESDWSAFWVQIDPDLVLNHFASDLEISTTDMKGANVKPENFVYAAMAGGYKGNVYAYLVAALGDGDKLKSGTGYAILEVANPANTVNPKFMATWRRWKPKFRSKDCVNGQMGIAFEAPPAITATDYEQSVANVLYVPPLLVSQDASTEWATVMRSLSAAGWEF